MTTTLKGRLFQLYAWIARPTTIYSLKSLLKNMPDSDLVFLMSEPQSKQAFTIAWAEYGRRHANVKLDFLMENRRVLEVRATELILGYGVVAAC